MKICAANLFNANLFGWLLGRWCAPRSWAKLRVLAAGKRGAVLPLEWEGFQALLPVGQDFDT